MTTNICVNKRVHQHQARMEITQQENVSLHVRHHHSLMTFQEFVLIFVQHHLLTQDTLVTLTWLLQENVLKPVKQQIFIETFRRQEHAKLLVHLTPRIRLIKTQQQWAVRLFAQVILNWDMQMTFHKVVSSHVQMVGLKRMIKQDLVWQLAPYSTNPMITYVYKSAQRTLFLTSHSTPTWL